MPQVERCARAPQFPLLQVAKVVVANERGLHAPPRVVRRLVPADNSQGTRTTPRHRSRPCATRSVAIDSAPQFTPSSTRPLGIPSKQSAVVSSHLTWRLSSFPRLSRGPRLE